MKDDIQILIEVLSTWKNDESGFDGGVWSRYNTLEDETGIKKPRLKELMKDLKNKNIVDYGPTINQDGQINGMGYFLKDRFIDKSYEEILEMIDKGKLND